MTEREAVLRRHGYHALPVKQVVYETEEARSFVLEVPDELRPTFAYRPGQFCSVRIHVGEAVVARCYSMSSAPEVEGDLTFTVKRVPGGSVSNWLVDHLAAGTLIEVNPPSGNFCVGEGSRPIVAFCAGSGMTPVLSIAKSVLATSSRPVSLLYANRDRGSVIFRQRLDELQAQFPGRFDVLHHLDLEAGFVDPAVVADFVGGRVEAEFFICGPGPFMDVVEETLLDVGVGPQAMAIERFETTVGPETTPSPETAGADGPESIVLILQGKKHQIDYHAGDTVLEAARRANVATPSSCEAGNCATCMAQVLEGTVTMRVNDALSPEEVDDGWVLTCQSRPVGSSLTVEFEAL